MKASSSVRVRKIPLWNRQTYVQGVEASWDSGQWVAIVCSKGMVGCGAFDLKLMEAHHQVLAVARGTVDQPLITCEDLLDAKVWGATRLARGFGIRKGMSCRKAAELMS